MPRPPLVALLLVAAVLTPFNPAASQVPERAVVDARAARQADLTVSTGEVAAGADQVHGWFTITNRGSHRTARFQAALRIDGQRVRQLSSPALGRGRSHTIPFRVRVRGGEHKVTVCADSRNRVSERRERNNCRRLGTVLVETDTVPNDPVEYEPGWVFQIGEVPNEYWMFVPQTYDHTHQTPTRLVIFIHGCSGRGQDAAWNVKNDVIGAETADYIVMAPGLGKDGGCWHPDDDAPALLRAIEDVKTHFNVDPQRVVIGGYSSGSTLAGRVAFQHAEDFAGLFMLPGRPWWSAEERDESIENAAWKLNIAWRPHTWDEFYLIGDLRGDRKALRDAGWPLEWSETEADHGYDASDMNYLFSKISSWVAPS